MKKRKEKVNFLAGAVGIMYLLLIPVIVSIIENMIP